MFTLLLFIKSIVIGFVAAMPVGPIGVLCIDHSIRGGVRMGFSAGVGAALADGIFGFIGGLGAAALISGASDSSDPWEFKFIGATLILLLGLKNVFSNRAEEKSLERRSAVIKTFAMTFFLTLTNPLTILSFAAIFAGLGIVLEEIPKVAAIYLGFGIFLGSLLWWLSLAILSSMLSQRMNFQNVQKIAKLSGIVLIVFAAAIFVQIFYSFISVYIA